MKFATLLVLMACVAWQVQGRAQDEEPRAISRGLLKRGLLAKGKGTTTTTTQAPQEEAEYEDEAEYPAEGDVAEPSTEAPPSSTEGKKLVGSGVRPFRSNTDLLEALKRRRAQVAEAKLHAAGHPTQAPVVQEKEPSDAPVKANFSSKKRFNSGSRDTSNDDSSASAKPRPSRFGRPASKAVQAEPEPEEQNDAAPPTRQARTFNRRGGN